MTLNKLISQFDNEEALVIMRKGDTWQAGCGDAGGKAGFVSHNCSTLEEALEKLAKDRAKSEKEVIQSALKNL